MGNDHQNPHPQPNPNPRRDLAELIQQVHQSTDVERSAVLLIKALADEIARLKHDPRQASYLAGMLHVGAGTLAHHIVANTPSEKPSLMKRIRMAVSGAYRKLFQ